MVSKQAHRKCDLEVAKVSRQPQPNPITTTHKYQSFSSLHIVLQVYYVITDVATMVQEVADHQDMLRSLSESQLADILEKHGIIMFS